MSKFRCAPNNFVDETILGTPLPEATSTVNNNGDRYLSMMSVPSNQNIKRGSTSRLTGTIDYLKSFSEAIASVRKSPDGEEHSLLSVTDASFGSRLPSKASLGVLDIDALLGNEVLDNSQEIMEKLYQSHHRKISPAKFFDKREINNEVQGLPEVGCLNSLSSEFHGEIRAGEDDQSALGVPSFLLKADSTVSDSESMFEASLVGFSKGSYLSEASKEVAAIMGKDSNSSFGSERISFEPCEVSARSTSHGISSSNSKISNSSSQGISWNNMENDDMDEDFISDEEGMLKKLERDEQSFVDNFLVPINPDVLPDSNSSRLSMFSEFHDGEKIMVRPSWIGLEGDSDDPINISVGQYFQMKADRVPRSSDIHLRPDQRPNFGMKITSPRRREKGIPLVSDSLEESTSKTPHELLSNLNITQVISPTHEADEIEKSPEMVNHQSVSIQSLSSIDKILKQIDKTDSPNTIANKLLRYSSPSKLQESVDERLACGSPKNNVIERNLDDNILLNGSKKSGLLTPKIILNKYSGQGTGDEMTYARRRSKRPKETKNVKHEIPDLIKRLNSLERQGKNDKSAFKNVSNIVDKLSCNVAGPLDCSALYETLNGDLVMEGPLDCDTVNVSEVGREAMMAQESSGGKSWVEIPEEILLAGDENELQQLLCVGLGFSAHVPLVNLTNNWLMYQVSPLKKSGDGDIIFQQLPIRTLLAPGSHAEFEVVIAPLRAGKHSIELEVNVTNFMAEGNVPRQTYHTKLTLSSSAPKVVLISDGMNELNDKDSLNFGVLPEECSKKMSLHLLNAEKTDIPVRIVIDEMPEAYQAFGICNASRSPENNDSTLSNVDAGALYQHGINLQRKDLLSCDLSGSGSKSMVTISLYFQPPRIGMKPLTVNNGVSEFSARLRVELDVPVNSSSEYTVLKEVFLSGCVGLTKLEVGIESGLLILNSKEKFLASQSNDGRGAIPKHLQGSASIYPPVSQLIPICNLGSVPLDVTVCVTLPSGENSKGDDEMTVAPDSLSLQPGERSSLNISYKPRSYVMHECNRILSLKLNPSGPTISYDLKGVCVPASRNSWTKEDANCAIQPAETRLEKVNSSSNSAPQIIQATRTNLVWGSAPLDSEYRKSSFTLRNPTKWLERVSLAITGSEDYKLLNNESDVVRKTSFDLLPKQFQLVRVFFRPKKLGPSVGKLLITVYGGRELDKKIACKMMGLYGFGGCCKIEVIALPKDMAGRPWLNLGIIFSNLSGAGALDFGTPMKANTSRSASPSQSAPSLKSRLVIHNAGSLTAYVKIIPLKIGAEPDSLTNPEEGREHFVTVRPDTFQLEPLTAINVSICYVHGLGSNSVANEGRCNKGERALEVVAKLLIITGEVATRARLRKIYKTAEIIHVNKNIGQFLELNGTSLSFIGVESKEGVVTELEDSPDGDEGEKHVSSLCDPASKDAVQSLVQNIKSIEVLLAVEKETGAKEPENDANASRLVHNEVNASFLTLMDDQDASQCVISNSSLYPENSSSNSMLCGETWSIEPEGTVYLGASHGTSSTLVLRNHCANSIIFEVMLGLLEPDDSVKWIPPSHRQSLAGGSLLMVEPWQGQLPPFGSVQLKLFLQKDSKHPLLNGVMQVYSENDSLKVNIKIKGNSQHMPERLQESSILNRAMVVNDSTIGGSIKHFTEGEKAVPVRKEPAKSVVPLSQKNKENGRNSLYVETSSIKFPVTKVGSLTYQKLVLKNPTDEHYKVHIFPVSEPFVIPHEIGNIKDHFYKAIKVGFCPRSPGYYQQTVNLEVASFMSSKTQSISVTLNGRSVL